MFLQIRNSRSDKKPPRSARVSELAETPDRRSRSLGGEVGSPAPNARNGFTLMEMMIVIAIMLLLVIATLPRIKQGLEDSKVRESSRQLNSYIALAKARAASTGRPCGLWFVSEQIGDPTGVPPNVAFHTTQVYLAEIPPAYSGDFLESRVVITNNSGNGPPTFANGPWLMNFAPAGSQAGLTTLIQPGDGFAIRFDHKGPMFNGQRDVNSGNFYITNGPTLPPHANGNLNTNAATAGYQYEIVRNAQRIGAPLNLPRGTSIDLAYSGFGNYGTDFYAAQNPVNSSNIPAVLILFTPEGRVGNVTFRTWDSTNSQYITPSIEAQGTIHFLVGRPERVGLPLAQSNLFDQNALWVSVGRLTGSVVTTENAPDFNFPLSNPPTATEAQNFLTRAREFAITQDVKGGQ